MSIIWTGNEPIFLYKNGVRPFFIKITTRLISDEILCNHFIRKKLHFGRLRSTLQRGTTILASVATSYLPNNSFNSFVSIQISDFRQKLKSTKIKINKARLGFFRLLSSTTIQYATLWYKTSADKTAVYLACCRKFCPPKIFVS